MVAPKSGFLSCSPKTSIVHITIDIAPFWNKELGVMVKCSALISGEHFTNPHSGVPTAKNLCRNKMVTFRINVTFSIHTWLTYLLGLKGMPIWVSTLYNVFLKEVSN